MTELIKKSVGVGVVRAVYRRRVVVVPVSADGVGTPALSASRKGCAAAAGCGKCGGCVQPDGAAGRYAGGFHITVSVPNVYKPGDRVRYVRHIPEPNLTAALVFGVPVIFAAAALLYGMTVAPLSVESPKTALTAAAAFFAGVAAVGILDKLFKIKYPSSISNIREAAL